MKEGEEQQESLFPELEGVEARGAAANLEAAQKRLGENLAAFLPWYFENNPGWIENCLREITVAAGESFRDFIGRKAETGEPIPAPFSVEFRFPVEVCPATLFVAPPPELSEIPAAELAAFRERGREISAAAVERILQEKAAEAAASGTPAPEITQEQREAAIRAAEAAGEELLATHSERNLQADLGEWFTAWRWAYAINAGWTSYRDTGPDAAPESDTLCLFHFTAPERKEPDPLWKKSETIAFRLQTLRARLARGEDFPEGDGPDAVEGRKLFDQLCPEGKLEKLSIPIAGLKGETDPDPETGKKKPVAFNIKLEIHPLTFDYRGEQGEERGEPETYFPFIILCESEPGAAGWHEIPPADRQELFRRILEPLEADATPENWDFPDWQPLSIPEPEANPPKRKRGKQNRPRKFIEKPPSKYQLELFEFYQERPFIKQSSDLAWNITAGQEHIKEISPSTLASFQQVTGQKAQWVGFNLRALGFLVFHAMRELFAKRGRPKGARFIVTPEEYLEATGLEKVLCSDGKWRFPPEQARIRLEALVIVSLSPGIMRIAEKDPSNPDSWRGSEFIGAMFTIVRYWDDLTSPEAKEFLSATTPADIAKMKQMEIQLFEKLWEIADGSRFSYIPTNYWERLKLAERKAGLASKPSPARQLFLEWLSDEGQRQLYLVEKYKRAKAHLEIDWRQLADKMHLHKYLSQGRRGLIVNEIKKAAKVAFHMGYIGPFGDCWDKKKEVFRFDLKEGPIWKEIEEYKRSVKAKAAVESPTWQDELSIAEKRKMRVVAGLANDYREKPWKTKRDALVDCLNRTKEEKNKEAARRDVGEEERKARCAMLGRVIRAIEAAMNEQLPPPRTKPAPAIPAPEPEPEQPPPDPEAAAIWEPILAEAIPIIPDQDKELFSSAIPARLEGSGPDRRLVVWIKSNPTLTFFRWKNTHKAPFDNASLPLAWISPGEEGEPTPFP